MLHKLDPPPRSYGREYCTCGQPTDGLQRCGKCGAALCKKGAAAAAQDSHRRGPECQPR